MVVSNHFYAQENTIVENDMLIYHEIMNIYFDDSGDFFLPKGTEEKVSLWIGIVIPESCEGSVKRIFYEWESTVREKGGNKKEIKGSDLDLSRRELLFATLHNESDLLIQPVIIDLQTQRQYSPVALNQLLKELSFSRSANLISADEREQVQLQGRRIGNLSNEQIMKFFTLIHCIIESTRHALIFRSHNKFRDCWNNINYWVDRSSKKPQNREESVFWESFGWTLRNYTKKEPLQLLDWIHDDKHPFVKNFVRGDHIDGKALFRNVHFEDSTGNWGLRLADIYANSLKKALGDLDNTKGELHLYEMIMEHSPLGPNSNLGFIVIVDEKGLEGNARLGKYAVLQKIIASRKR